MMDLVLGNPAGLWGLLAVPAILAIHVLQRQARPQWISTLFLLEHAVPERAGGRRWERLRTSPQLWLHLAAVLVLTWLLVQPRWPRVDSVQRVVVVLDSSASMAAFTDRLPHALGDALAPLARAARTTEWRVQGSHPGAPTIYRGTQLDELLEQVKAWRPRQGAHAFDDALAAAGSVAGPDGTVVLVTDHEPPPVAAEVEWLGVGEPVDQCGFAGLQVLERDGVAGWRAMVRNYGSAPADRTWRVEAGGLVLQEASIRLAPGEARTIEGGFPGEAGSLVCVLDADRFALDDRLPIVWPRKKTLRLAVAVGAELDASVGRWIEVMGPVARVARGDDPDLEVSAYQPGVPPDTTRNRISLPVPGAFAPAGSTADPVVSAEHPLTRDLVWQGLVCRPVPIGALTAADEVLLWQGAVPLAVLRTVGERRHLVIGFDLGASNADRLPAFVVMLYRFVESVRARTPGLEARNVELEQPLRPAVWVPGPAVVLETADPPARAAVPAEDAGTVRAPSEPGAFALWQGDTELLRGAAHFADVREADLRRAVAFNGLESRVLAATRLHSEPDRLATLWAVVLGAVLLGVWAAKPNGRSGGHDRST